MEWLKYLALGMASLVMVIGMTLVALAALAPRLLESAAVKRMFGSETREPIRRKRILLGVSHVLLGIFIWLTVIGQVVPALLVYVVWLAMTVMRFRARTLAARSLA